MADVIIFDDDPSIGDLAGEVLRGLDLSVEHYLSGAGAAQIVQEARPRLVVLDIMMQGLDGLSACRAIKSRTSTRHVKVLVVTSKDFPHEKERALRYGADVFLPKPFLPEQLARCVADLLGLARPAAAAAAPTTVSLLDRGAVLDGASLRVLFDAGAGTAAWLREHPARPDFCWLLLSRCDGGEAAAARGAQTLLGEGCRLRVAGPDTPEGELQLLAPGLSGPGDEARPLPLLFPQREGEFQL
ncbi:MAG: response regulator, partial [Elusimicrobia bacterium]|nr:response regulator [Elusimicrobiota bacterium]